MDPTTAFLVAGGALLVLNGLYGQWIKGRTRHLRRWQAAAAQCGLSKVKEGRESAWHPAELIARSDRLRVRFSSYDHGNEDGTHVRIAADWPPALVGFALHPETAGTTSEEKRLEIVVGDHDFDEAFLVGGPASAVRAWLHVDTRRRLLELHARCHVMISHGELHVQIPARKHRSLAEVLALQLEVARRLEQRLHRPHALGSHVRHDPEPAVRLQCLLALAREFPDDDDTAPALRAACSDPHPEVRLRAALALGLEGQGTLFELAERLVDDACAAAAIAALGQKLGTDRLLSILGRARGTRRLAAARECLQILGRSATPAVLATLAEILASDDELAADVARALGATGLPSAEEPLIAALSRDFDVLRVAAAVALGRVGRAASVLPLREAASRYPQDKDLGRATRTAIAKIQARLTGATPGQVSLASDGAGHLSVADDEAGRLSDPKTES